MKRGPATATASPYGFDDTRDLLTYLEYAMPDVEALSADGARWLALAIVELREATGARSTPADEGERQETRGH